MEVKSEKINTYVQRDLEDQIKEELEKRKSIQNREQMSTSRAPEIKISEVLSLLGEGYTRYEADNIGYGSIQVKYNLTVGQVKELFSHPGLKGVKRKVPKIKVVDDREAPKEAEVVPTSKPEEDIFS